MSDDETWARAQTVPTLRKLAVGMPFLGESKKGDVVAWLLRYRPDAVRKARLAVDQPGRRTLRQGDIGFTVPDVESMTRYNDGERPFCPHCDHRASWGYGVRAWVHAVREEACGKNIGEPTWKQVW